MQERRNPGCAFGPCNDSKQVGGHGCHLCDDIATLPQRGRGATVEEAPDGGAGDDVLASPNDGETKKAKKQTAAPRRTTKRTSASGGLF